MYVIDLNSLYSFFLQFVPYISLMSPMEIYFINLSTYGSRYLMRQPRKRTYNDSSSFQQTTKKKPQRKKETFIMEQVAK